MASELFAERVYNFSAGPAVLPLAVLQQIQRELIALPNVGSSILEISHRSSTFVEILETAKDRLKRLLNVPDRYHVLFLQGGARLQFSMVPMNLLRGQQHAAAYILTGSWGQKAMQEAVKEGQAHVVWDGQPTGYDRVPQPDELDIPQDAAYVHFTSNETIQGVQFAREPASGDVPLVCDASSDFLSRPIDVQQYGLIYACAQKNASPAGVTIVIIREDLLERSQRQLPGYLNYALHAKDNSLYNTPCTFGIYAVGIGSLQQMDDLNKKKASLLYEVIDAGDGFYRGHALPRDRSLMNVVFRLHDQQVEGRFLAQAQQHGLCSLKGHRSVGGIRASIYNAMPLEGVEALRDFMVEFRRRGG